MRLGLKKRLTEEEKIQILCKQLKQKKAISSRRRREKALEQSEQLNESISGLNASHFKQNTNDWKQKSIGDFSEQQNRSQMLIRQYS